MSKEIMLSVRLMTYNHSEHIIECLNGIENQKTTFPFEVVIGDDFSTDNNLELIQEFIQNTQNKNITYNLLKREKGGAYYNKRQDKGRLYNFQNIMENCNGKYIALLDGDDYWIDEDKLQKQVDYMEADLGCNICFTRAQLYRNGSFEPHNIPNNSDGIYSYEDLLEHANFIATASAVIRNNFGEIPEWFLNLPYGDLALYLIASKNAVIKCLEDTTTVYRVHEQGAWHKQSQKLKIINRLLFNQGIYPHLTVNQKNIIHSKQDEWIKKLVRISATKFPLHKYYMKQLYAKTYRLAS